MKEKDKIARGFTTVAPSHLQNETNSRFLFSGIDEIGKEVFKTFRPLLVSGMVTPDDFAADVAIAGSIPGTLTSFAPRYDLGKFSYYRPNGGEAASTQAGDPMALAKEKVIAPKAPTKDMSKSQPTAPPPRFDYEF